ncbi:hypothetical protein MMC28_000016 [Mycoblastus sanguinarius]|nr:hypothetical protein [Mycoblastus sanguinarius]
MASHSDTRSFPFLQLPGEIRNIIYKAALPDVQHPLNSAFADGERDTPLILQTFTALLLTNRQINIEAWYIFFKDNHFLLEVGPIALDFLNAQSFSCSKPLRYIQPYNLIRHLDVEIELLQLDPPNREMFPLRFVMENFQAACDTMGLFIGLKTITIRCKIRHLTSPSEWDAHPFRETEDWVDLLLLLKAFQVKQSDVRIMVEMPHSQIKGADKGVDKGAGEGTDKGADKGAGASPGPVPLMNGVFGTRKTLTEFLQNLEKAVGESATLRNIYVEELGYLAG